MSHKISSYSNDRMHPVKNKKKNFKGSDTEDCHEQKNEQKKK